MERFSEFANILFLKLISENGRKPWWNNIKKQSNEDLLGYINKIVIGVLGASKNTFYGQFSNILKFKMKI